MPFRSYETLLTQCHLIQFLDMYINYFTLITVNLPKQKIFYPKKKKKIIILKKKSADHT